jgi:hypothetical protein
MTLLDVRRPRRLLSPTAPGTRRPADLRLAAAVALAVVGLGPALLGPPGPGPVCSPTPVLPVSTSGLVGTGPVDGGGALPTGGGGDPMAYDDVELGRLAGLVVDDPGPSPFWTDLVGTGLPIC